MADSAESGIFEVEKILQKRVVKRKVEFMVRWRGFNSDFDTWEPKSNLSQCTELISAFENNNPSSKVNEKNVKKISQTVAMKLVKKSKVAKTPQKRKSNTSKIKFNNKKTNETEQLSTEVKATDKKTDLSEVPSKSAAKSSVDKTRKILKMPKKTKKNESVAKSDVSIKKKSTSPSLVQNISDEKGSGKGQKRKRSNSQNESAGKRAKKTTKKPVQIDVEENSDDDDDDVLYSLVETSEKSIKEQIEDVRSKHENSNKEKLNVNKPETFVKPMCVTTQQQKKTKESSKLSHHKLSLIDGLKSKPLKTDAQPVPSSLVPYYTSVKPLMTPSLSLLSKAMPSHSITMESYFADIPSYQMANALPVSPSSISYKALLDNLPQQMHPKKKRKEGDEESLADSDDDKIERRISVRSAECAFRYKEIVVKKCQGYSQIWLNTHTHLKNALNPQVIQEIVSALNSAKYDDSNLVMFSSIGNVFCSGVDLHFLTRGDRRIAARQMSDSLRELIKAFITFPKPIIAVVSGAAVGLGMAILPLCDITYASDKAQFHLPYSALSQTPEGCSSFTLPQVLGLAVGSEILFCGRKLTALEAHQLGLVSQVFWPTSMMQEVIPRVQQMALFSGKALETTKLLIRCHSRTKLELTNETECNLLLERWPTADCQRAISSYLDNDKNFIY